MTDYYLTMVDETTLIFGADFNKLLSTAPPADATISTSIDWPGPGLQGKVEYDAGFTPVGDPGVAGIGGNFTVTVNVQTGNTDLTLGVELHRINSSGTTLASHSHPSPVSATAGSHVFEFVGLDFGTWQAGDRFRVVFSREDLTTMGAETLVYGVGALRTTINTPWSLGGTPHHPLLLLGVGP